MLLFLLADLGGLLSIFSPCVLPVLPFVFARSDRPFRQSGLPVLTGMAVTFTALASLAVAGSSWLVRINQYGRYLAMLLLLLLGVALLSPALSDRIMRPFVALGTCLQQRAGQGGTIRASLLVGIAVGFLWALCGGPILGLVLTGAALNGLNLHSILLLLFAAGSATSLAGALAAGGRILDLMRRGLGAEVWVRRGLGVAVIAGVIAAAFGFGTRALTSIPLLDTTRTEQQLIRRFSPQPDRFHPVSGTTPSLPSLEGVTLWLNSPPLHAENLQGKVVLIDFWTYSCINCLRTLPYLKAWERKYRSQGLVIIGVHTPEFAFEKERSNVEKAVADLGVTYPVALDNGYVIWNRFGNSVWPAHYLFDARG